MLVAVRYVLGVGQDVDVRQMPGDKKVWIETFGAGEKIEGFRFEGWRQRAVGLFEGQQPLWRVLHSTYRVSRT